ncbi:MAG: efflux RND transporter periplasmic adaptor subunit [Alphaproteobacteria bacterium]
MKTKTFLITSVAAFALVGTLAYREFIPPSHAAEEHGHEEEGGEEHAEEEGIVKLDDAQLSAAGIKIVEVGPGTLAREVNVPGKVVAAADRMAHIVPKVSGVVTEARKNLGDTVKKGEVLALIESREMAEAVADLLAAKRAEELAQTTYEREKSLWDKKITAEQDYLNAKNAHQEAGIRLDLAKQKLQALGHEGDVTGNGNARFHQLKAPLDGRVIARELTLGEYVDTTHTAFTVADLSVVWVETAIAPGDLPFVKEGQMANVVGGSGKGEGKLAFISPAIDPETRSAKAIIELDNKDGHWRPGDFANAAIATSAQEAKVLIPKEAIQSIEGQNVVFVKTAAGFEKRVVGLGREDSRHVEIVSGLAFGEPVAITGTFTLKAEFGKAEAEHAH